MAAPLLVQIGLAGPADESLEVVLHGAERPRDQFEDVEVVPDSDGDGPVLGFDQAGETRPVWSAATTLSRARPRSMNAVLRTNPIPRYSSGGG